MTDHRVEAAATELITRLTKPNTQVLSVAAQYEIAETAIAAADAADSAAGYIRIDLNDEALLARLADAIEVPQMYVDGDDNETWLEWQQRAIRAALKGPRS